MKNLSFRQILFGGVILLGSVFLTVQYQNCSTIVTKDKPQESNLSESEKPNCFYFPASPGCQPLSPTLDFLVNDAKSTSVSVDEIPVFSWSSKNLQTLSGTLKTIDDSADVDCTGYDGHSPVTWLSKDIRPNETESFNRTTIKPCQKGKSYLLTLTGIGVKGEKVSSTVTLSIDP